jgi:phospholipid/cholesterol/gamma-HCH transport system substrate-binding protein
MARGKLNRGTQRASQIRVGLVLIVGLIVLVLGVYQVGRLFDVFASRYPLITLVENSVGIMAGAPVTLAGQRVGQVDEVEFIPVEERVGDANIRIRMVVNQAHRDQIRTDSRATLRTQGLLGDRFIDISPGSSARPVLRPGDTIASQPALDIEEVLDMAAATLADVQGIATELNVITGRLARGEGTMGALLTDDRLYERMTVASSELAGLLATMNRADGTVARLIRDPAMYDRMESALVRLDSVAGAVLTGQGTLGRLMHDDALYESLLGVTGRADTTIAGVEGFIRNLTEADGTIARLLEDPELYDQLLKAIVDVQNLINDIRENPREYRPDVNVRVF